MKTAKKTPAPVDVITELELMALATTRDSLRLLQAQLRSGEDKLAAQEQQLIARLAAGADVEGDLQVRVVLRGPDNLVIERKA